MHTMHTMLCTFAQHRVSSEKSLRGELQSGHPSQTVLNAIKGAMHTFIKYVKQYRYNQ